MASVTLLALRTVARDRADMNNSTFITDDLFSQYINDACGELYDLLVTKFQDYYVTSSDLAFVAGNSHYSLPTDFYKALGVDVLSSGKLRPLERFEFAERNLYLNSTAASLADMRYRIRGSEIIFAPAPPADGEGTLWYVPRREVIDGDSDTFDPINEDWAAYVTLTAAIKALMKEESDVSALLAEKAEIKRRIDEAAANRDTNGPARVVDAEGLARDNILTDYQWARRGI